MNKYAYPNGNMILIFSLALDISDQLSSNREKIESAHNKVKKVNVITRAGGKIISRMVSRDKRQRVLLYCVMAFIALAFLVILYFSLFGSSGTTTPSGSN